MRKEENLNNFVGISLITVLDTRRDGLAHLWVKGESQHPFRMVDVWQSNDSYNRVSQMSDKKSPFLHCYIEVLIFGYKCFHTKINMLVSFQKMQSYNYKCVYEKIEDVIVVA